MNEIDGIISKLGLNPHPEGGYYRETFRSEGRIPHKLLKSTYSGDRNYMTAIYFLITSESFSAFHRIHQDEMWHFYKGSAMKLHMISPEGDYKVVRIGSDIKNGDHPQYNVPGGTWFASEVDSEDGYSLLGCTVSPGFDFDDFTMASRKQLCNEFPQHSEIIIKLTRE